MKLTVQIPLDYYRILSVPVTATEAQLQQAYEDRLQQKPRREYGEKTIATRQKLIELAYNLLSDPQRRAEYNSQFFSNSRFEERLSKTATDSETATAVAPNPTELSLANPTIEIPTEQMAGVLSILYEMGEYELVLKLGINYLNSVGDAERERLNRDECEDIILSLALSYLELGREQWYRREYENAALSGQMGLKILAKENLFPKVKQELEVDLHRLQPYRILELIAQNPVNSPQRNKGLQLLTDLLRQRQGIEGRGSDQTSPNLEQFLCFIQQIRTYLTSAEQEKLFVREASSDSAISNYLAAYVSIARGYALRQPDAILHAQTRLEFLSQRQDVCWELAICSLLLGLSDRAINLMQQSQDREKIDKVRQYSENSPDLLLGMCVYGEEWLRHEVLGQFCDLATSSITLKAYFANPQVESYLEELAPVPTANQTKVKPTKSATTSVKRPRLFSRWRKPKAKVKTAIALETSQLKRPTKPSASKAISVGAAKTAVNGSIPQQRFSQAEAMGKNGHQRQSTSKPAVNGHSATAATATHPDAAALRRQLRSRRTRGDRAKSAPVALRLLLLLGFVLGVGTLGYAAMKLFLNRSSQVAIEPQLPISLNYPLLELPPVEAITNTPPPQPTFAEEAERVVRRWLDSKSAAFGEQYQVEQLNEVLIGSLLTAWRDRALSYQQTDTHREYDHEITIKSAAVDKNNPQQATVEAEVKEVARHYQQGNLDESQSYDDDLLVRYSLVRQGDKWMIAGSEVLEIL